MRKTKQYTERRVYFFPCSKCKKPNCKSYRRKYQRLGICRSCRREATKISPGQIDLLGGTQ